MKFDLTGFKKISSNDKTTTLQHPSGHQMTINHSILSPKLRGDIAALPSQQKDSAGNKHPDKSATSQLADGGVAPSPQEFSSDAKKDFEGPETPAKPDTDGYAKPVYSPAQKPIDQAEKDRITASTARNKELYGEAEGGEIKPRTNETETYGNMQQYAEGTPDKPVEDNGPEAADRRVLEQTKAEEDKQLSDKQADSARSESAISEEQQNAPKGPGGPDQDSIKSLIDSHKNLTDAHNAIIQSLAGQPNAQPQPASALSTDQTNITANAIPGADQTATGPAQPPIGGSEGSYDTQTPDQTQPAVQAQPVQGSSIPGYDKPMASANSAIDERAQYLKQQQTKSDQLLQAAQSGKVDPSALFANRSTSTKITNILGLILGGMGAGGTGGRNLALDALNRSIEQDVDAQKANIGNKMNLYKMNLEATKNGEEARSATINQQLTLAQAAIAKQAAQTTNQTALLGLQNLNQDIIGKKLENDLKGYKASVLNSIDSTSSQAPVGQIDQNRFNKLVLSGVMPKEDATAATKEAQNYQEGQKLRQNMEDSAKHLDKQIGAGAFTPSDRASAVNAFAGRIAKIAEGRFNLEESKLQAQALLPSPLDAPSTVKNKTLRRAQFFDSLTPTTTLERYHLLAPSQSGGQIKTMNGVPYKLGTDGQYHKVQ